MIKNPCKPDCPKRCKGCAITCKAWKLYTKKRDKKYKERAGQVGIKYRSRPYED